MVWKDSCRTAILVALALLLAPAALASAQEESGAAPAAPTVQELVDALAPRYRDWVINVSGLMTQGELRYFAGLPHDYQRDAFMDAFWEPRDPDPRTRVNELRQRWQQLDCRHESRLPRRRGNCDWDRARPERRRSTPAGLAIDSDSLFYPRATARNPTPRSVSNWSLAARIHQPRRSDACRHSSGRNRPTKPRIY